MFFHACKMDQRRIVVNSMNRRRFENKNHWRIGHNPSMENWKRLTVADYTKRRNQENHLTFTGSCGRDFNACLFWIDWKGRAELLLNKNKTWLHHISLIRKYLIDWKAVKKHIWFSCIKNAIQKNKSWKNYSLTMKGRFKDCKRKCPIWSNVKMSRKIKKTWKYRLCLYIENNFIFLFKKHGKIYLT